MIFISGVFYDADDAPQFLRDIAQVLPLTHLIDGLLGRDGDGRSLADNASGLCVVVHLGVVGLVLRGARLPLGRAARRALRPSGATRAGGPPIAATRDLAQRAVLPVGAQHAEDVDVELAVAVAVPAAQRALAA